MVGHLSKLAEEMGFTRIKEDIKLNSPRIVVHGKVNGFPVDLNLYDEDLTMMDENGAFWPDIDSGKVNVIIADIKKAGFEPASTSAPAAAGSGPAWKNKKSSWACPEHGDQFVKEMRGNKFCSKSQEARDDEETGPDWAKDEPKEYNGVYRWYCKYNERSS